MATYNGNSDTITKLVKGDIINYSYAGSVKSVALPKGQYKLECWGAQGGTGYTRTGTSSTSYSYTSVTSSNYSSYFSLSNGSYYFSGSSSGWSATNTGVNRSTATTTWTCNNAGTYVISWNIVTESGYDEFTLTAGGSTYASAISGTQSSSATVSLSSGSTIVATYSKDSSQHASGESVVVTIQYRTSTTTWSYGSATSYSGGKGGYSYGTITIKSPVTAYIRAGGQRSTSTSTSKGTQCAAGFNGGGIGMVRCYTSGFTTGGGGGGGSDIRIGTDSLYARVIVAGGGGGAAGVNDSSKYGGGTNGGSYESAYAGTQTAGGTSGSFGQGANSTSSSNYNYGSGAGGGGWYGGGAYQGANDSDTSYRQKNGGGSGYVYTSSTASNYPSGCTLNSTYYLDSASTVAGNTSFASTSGGTETGHSGNGYVRITVLKIDTIDMPVNIGGTWKTGDSVYVNIGGTWKTADALYVNIGGVWKSQ